MIIDIMRRNKDSLLLYLIALFSIATLFLPKINLLSFAGESAGIRIDDLFLLFCMGYFSIIYLINDRKNMSEIEISFAFFIFFLFSSYLLDKFLAQQAKIFYLLRYLEYFTFIFLGKICFEKKFSLIKICYFLIFCNGITIVLQMFSLIGGFSSEGFVPIVSRRPIGLTGGPWEVGVVLNIAFAVIATRTSGGKVNVVFFLCLLLIIITGSRLPLLSLFITYSWFLINKNKNNKKIIFIALPSLALMATLFLLIPNPILDRSSLFFSTDGVESFKDLYAATITTNKFEDFEEVNLADDTNDVSWLIREAKWVYAIKMIVAYPGRLILGLGPGSLGIALDGGWLRAIIEYGLIGFTSFIIFFNKIRKIDILCCWLTYIIFINMIMIDINLSYKAMSLYFFIIGYVLKEQQQSNGVISTSCKD